MKIAELIARLQQYPPEMEALVEGYETGFDDIHSIEIKSLARYTDAEEWDGEFDENLAGAQEMLVILGRRDGRRYPRWQQLVERAATNLEAREKLRRRALRIMANRDQRAQALADLDHIERLDIDAPIGDAASWTLDQLATRVPIRRRDDPLLEVVRPSDIPEPWRSRMAAASTEVTMISNFPGYYIDDWREFLRLWRLEHEQLREYRLDRP